MQDFRNLKVWDKSHRLTIHMYTLTRKLPRYELWGLIAQIRRASASIGANIAEGCGRDGDAELARFLQIAICSASELEYHLLLARGLGFISSDEYDRGTLEVGEVKRMLSSLIRNLKPCVPRKSPTRANLCTNRLTD